MKSWKLTEIKYLREHYLSKTDKELAAHFNVTVTALSSTRKRHGILKSKEQQQFKKGQKPFNTGMKQVEFMSADGMRRCKPTQFKKGQKPHNAIEVGTVRCIKDKTGKPYLFIKTPERKQYPYGRYVWEQTTGETLTRKEVIRFKDNNPLNCAFENLMKITTRENALMNVNRQKAANSLKKVWAVVHAFEDYGLTPPYKFRGRKAS